MGHVGLQAIDGAKIAFGDVQLRPRRTAVVAAADRQTVKMREGAHPSRVITWAFLWVVKLSAW